MTKTNLTFEKLTAGVTDEARTKMIADIATQLDARVAFETAKNPGNDNIQKTLKKVRERLTRPGIAAVLLAADVPPGFINREEFTGKRFNVYGLEKVDDIAYGLVTGHFKNAINNAVMRSMFKFRAAGYAFTGMMAQAAASDKVKVDKAIAEVLVRHTVSAGTAPTQSSSTMNALEVLGVVTNTGTMKHPVYQLTDAPITRRLEELLSAKAA